MEYPFITDFMIQTKAKSYAIFIVDEENHKEKDEGILPSLQENSLEYFGNRCTVITVSKEEDIKNILFTLEKKR